VERTNVITKPANILLQLFAVGAAGHLIYPLRPVMIFLTPFFLAFTGIFLAYLLYREGKTRTLWWILFVYVNTFTVEALGVATGKIFGPYFYGDALGLKFFGVPLVIGMNWAFVILGGVALAKKMTRNPVLMALITGLLAAGFDFILEPVAIRLNYWHWVGGSIPFQNYAMWFTLAFVNTLIFSLWKVSSPLPVFRAFFLIQTGYFLILNVGLRLAG
jgi:putative membrane protein